VTWIQEGEAFFPAERWPTFRALHALNLGGCLQELGRLPEALDALTEYRDLAPYCIAPHGVEAHGRALRGGVLVMLGDYSAAIVELERASALDESIGIMTHFRYAEAQLALGQPERALETVAWALERRDLWVAFEGQLLHLYGKALARMGKTEEALNYLEQSLHSPYHEPIAWIASSMAECLAQVGRLEEAVRSGQQALASAEEVQSPVSIAAAARALGNALLAQGETAAALMCFRRALAHLEALGLHRDAAATLQQIAKCRLALGEDGEALANLEAGLTHLAQVGRRFLPEEGRSLFLAQWADTPALVSELVLRLTARGDEGAAARGFRVVDAFQARTLLEGLQERSDAGFQATSGEQVAARERTLDELMTLRLELTKDHAPDERTRLETELRAKEVECAEAEQRVRLANPALSESCIRIPFRSQSCKAPGSDLRTPCCNSSWARKLRSCG
jgi:tetratricopeptide (TPR) repeat protein